MVKESRWDADYAFGVQGELLVTDVLAQVAAGQVRREVKSSRWPDDSLFVELEHNPFGTGWCPSGLNVSESEYWAFTKPGGIFVLIPAEALRAQVERRRGKQPLTTGGADGDCPTRGLIVPLRVVLEAAGENPPARLFDRQVTR